MDKNTKNTKETGDLGEKLAQRYLTDHGFTIMKTNYWRKWGEIDVVAQDVDGRIHFIEVKTVSYETKEKLESALISGDWCPEEQVTARKLHQIHKAMQTWVAEHEHEGEVIIDVIAIRMVPHETYATVNFIENITQ